MVKGRGKSKRKTYRTRGKTYKVRSKVSRKSYSKSYRKSTKKRKNKRRGSKKKKLYGGSFRMVKGAMMKSDVFKGVVKHPKMYELSNKYSDEQNELAKSGMNMADTDIEDPEQLQNFQQHILKVKEMAEKAAMLEAMSKDIGFDQFTLQWRPSGLTDKDRNSLDEIWKRFDPKEWQAQNFTSQHAKQVFIESGGELSEGFSEELNPDLGEELNPDLGVATAPTTPIEDELITTMINRNPMCTYNRETGAFRYGATHNKKGVFWKKNKTAPPKEWMELHGENFDTEVISTRSGAFTDVGLVFIPRPSQ